MSPVYPQSLSVIKKLPDKYEMVEWARSYHEKNHTIFDNLPSRCRDPKLIRNNFLIYFLIQHYAQHYESMLMGLSKRHLGHSVPTPPILTPLKPMPLQRQYRTIESGNYTVGTTKSEQSYDNESPSHKIFLNSFKIATKPITNGEYLQFIVEESYTKREYWNEAGWQWLRHNELHHPIHWRQTPTKGWFGLDERGAYQLESTEPVSGINHFEATAFANWAKARLPHEHEWEIACKNNLLSKTNQVWEWCSNTFFPYPGFNAFPYSGYSEPYFGGAHYTLKGGSNHTQKPIKRPSFRNYYQPDQRHQLCGLRLVFP